MFIDGDVKIGKTSDGSFIISFDVGDEKRDKGAGMSVSERKPRTLAATSMNALFAQLKKILPKMKNGQLSKTDFDAAFDQATKEG